MQNLVRKGHRRVAQEMRLAGYSLDVCYDVDDKHIAEYTRTCAGITVDWVVIQFNANWRCVSVEKRI